MTRRGLVFNIQKFSIHDGPGIRTAVFFQGCPLRCKWCSNPESQEFPQDADARETGRCADGAFLVPPKWYTSDEILAVCLEDKDFYDESGGGVTLSGGEIFVQHEFAGELLEKLGEQGIARAIESSGYADPEMFARIAELSELVLFDIKHHDRERHRAGTGVDNDRILENLASLTFCPGGPELLPRVPVIPGYNDSLADAGAFAALLLSFGLDRVQLLPFHQFGKKKYGALNLPYQYADTRILHSEDLEEYRTVFTAKGVRAFF